MSGKNSWFIVDGYRPPEEKGGDGNYKGHECIMILNCNGVDANVTIDVYFMDRPAVKGIQYRVPAERISAFRTNDKSVFKNVDLACGLQYSLMITSDVGVVVQYGRMDVNQDNLAYIATLGYSE